MEIRSDADTHTQIPISTRTHTNDDEEKEELKRNADMMNKLDVLMSLLFEYLVIVRAAGSKLCDKVFHSLLRVFESTILSTHKARFTQFLLFYACSIQHQYAEMFLNSLLRHTFNPANGIVFCQRCVAYIASFVARSKSLRHATFIMIFDRLLNWAHAYVQSQSNTHIPRKQHQKHTHVKNKHRDDTHQTTQHATMAPPTSHTQVTILDPSHHALFFSICQGIFHIFCLKQLYFKSLLKRSPQYAKHLKFEDLVGSKLNPLKYCSLRTAAEFITVCRSLHLLPSEGKYDDHDGDDSNNASNGYANHEIHNDTNCISRKSVVQSVEQRVNGSDHANTQAVSKYVRTDGFFPFDSYSLQQSATYIMSIYNTRATTHVCTHMHTRTRSHETNHINIRVPRKRKRKSANNNNNSNKVISLFPTPSPSLSPSVSPTLSATFPLLSSPALSSSNAPLSVDVHSLST